MRALYLSAFSSNLGDRQASLFTQRGALNSFAQNLGLASSTAELFPDGVEKDFAEPSTWGTDFDIVFVGGAGLLGPNIFRAGWEALNGVSKPIAVLGVGENVPNSLSLLPRTRPDRPVFVGLRHSDATCYFPCPSLVHDSFFASHADLPQKRPRMVAGYFHHRRRMKVSRFIPNRMKNNRSSLEEVIQHLRSARFLVTDSYHGALWGGAIGSRVVLLDRFRRRKAKFRSFPKRRNRSAGSLHRHLARGVMMFAEWKSQLP